MMIFPPNAPLHQNGALLLDLRSPQEYEAGHPPGSISLPLERLPQQIGRIAPDHRQPLLLYCSHGHRSRTAAQVLRRMGYQQIRIVHD